MIEVGTTEKWSTMTSPRKAGFVFQKKRDLLPRINSRSDATYAWLSLRRARFTGSALFRALYTLVFLFRIVPKTCQATTPGSLGVLNLFQLGNSFDAKGAVVQQ